MTALMGVLIGLVLPPAWRLWGRLRAALGGTILDVHSKERREMLARGGHL